MTPDEFTAWLAFMKMKKLATTDAEAAAALRVHPNTLSRWKQRGAPFIVALACASLYDQRPPWRPEHIF